MDRSASYAQVLSLYMCRAQPVINGYKRGHIDTDGFFDALRAMLTFFNRDDFTLFADDLDWVEQNRGRLTCLEGVGHKQELTADQKANALIERTWNATIEVSDGDIEKLRFLLSGDYKNVIFISNTNKAHVNLITRHFIEADFFNEVSNDITFGKQLSTQVKLVVSYDHGVFKSNEDNLNNTPGLLSRAFDGLIRNGHEADEIDVISQFSGDHTMAGELGIKAENIYQAQDYFTNGNSPTFS